MEKLNTCEKNLRLPKTPSYWIGAQYHTYLELMMTCGGGMGGARWYEYVEPIDIPATPQILLMTDIDGNVVNINTAYVVKAREVCVVTVQYHSDNPYFRKGLYTERYIAPNGEKITLCGPMKEENLE